MIAVEKKNKAERVNETNNETSPNSSNTSTKASGERSAQTIFEAIKNIGGQSKKGMPGDSGIPFEMEKPD